MKCGEIIEKLEEKYPCSLAESWDNPGLQVGRREKEIRNIFVALDPTIQVLEEAIKNKTDLLITHHPLLMSPLKNIVTDDFIGKRIVRMIQEDISCYSMHTNYDIITMGALAGEILQLSNMKNLLNTCEYEGKEEGFGRIGTLPHVMSLLECGEYVKKCFGLDSVKIFGDNDLQIKTAAVLPGSGKSMVNDAIMKHADVMISGDFGHHDGIDALMKGIAVIDAGHYGLEHIFMTHMSDYLQTSFPTVKVYAEEKNNPFQIV